MRELGLQCEPHHLVAVFETLDADGSGALEYKEFERLLRASRAAQPTIAAPAARPRARGKGT